MGWIRGAPQGGIRQPSAPNLRRGMDTVGMVHPLYRLFNYQRTKGNKMPKFIKDDHTPGVIEQEILNNFLNKGDLLRIAKKSKDLRRDITNKQISNCRENLLLLAQRTDEILDKLNKLSPSK